MIDDAVPIFYSNEFFKLGDDLVTMGEEWGEILRVVLENSGSDPLGHMTLDELTELWPLGIDADLFLNKVSACRVQQIAKSFNVIGLAVHLFDSTYSGVLHPLGFTIRPMDQAPHIDMCDRCEWSSEILSWQREVEAEVLDGGDVRVAGYMQGVLIVSLGGSSRSHLLQFFRSKIIDLPPPFCVMLEDEEGVKTTRPPVINVIGNFSKIASYAVEHQHIIYDPDEFGLAFMPQKGQRPTGSAAAQMMSFPELLTLLKPPKGAEGFEGVIANRRFNYPNGLVSTLQLQRVHLYFNEDYSATTFRVLKALVPENVVFGAGQDADQDFSGMMQKRKYKMIASQLYPPHQHPLTHSYLSPQAYKMEQYMWRIIKGHLCKYARSVDKLVPFFLKFRDVIERLGHYAALDRLVACSEVATLLTGQPVPAWKLEILEVDIQSALLQWLCLLIAERHCLNVSEAAERVGKVCSKCRKHSPKTYGGARLSVVSLFSISFVSVAPGPFCFLQGFLCISMSPYCTSSDVWCFSCTSSQPLRTSFDIHSYWYLCRDIATEDMFRVVATLKLYHSGSCRECMLVRDPDAHSHKRDEMLWHGWWNLLRERGSCSLLDLRCGYKSIIHNKGREESSRPVRFYRLENSCNWIGDDDLNHEVKLIHKSSCRSFGTFMSCARGL